MSWFGTVRVCLRVLEVKEFHTSLRHCSDAISIHALQSFVSASNRNDDVVTRFKIVFQRPTTTQTVCKCVFKRKSNKKRFLCRSIYLSCIGELGFGAHMTWSDWTESRWWCERWCQNEHIVLGAFFTFPHPTGAVKCRLARSDYSWNAPSAPMYVCQKFKKNYVSKLKILFSLDNPFEIIS